jgi:hypothetical protein
LKAGIKLFQIRQPSHGEWWPATPLRATVQVWSVRLQDRLILPWTKIGIGTLDGGEWPKGIKSPPVTFSPSRSSTKIVGREDDLEQLIETAVRERVVECHQTLGIIGRGRDCVGHFTTRCDLKLVPPVVVRERAEPPIFLQIPELSVLAAVRIEQRTLSWKTCAELNGALLAREVTEEKAYQVSRAAAGAPWVWMEQSRLPLGAELGSNRRLVVTTQETFRAEVFERPWDTFGKVNPYDAASVPGSRVLESILGLLNAPPSEPLSARPKRRNYDE